MIHSPVSVGGLSGDPLVATRLTKRYRRGRPALSDVSVAVSPGTVTALVGPNGAGKSTLIKLWAGLEMPTSGLALVRGRRPDRAGRNVLHDLAYIPQTPSLYRELTVDDHIELAAHLRKGFDRSLARRHLNDLSIELDRSCGEISGGEAAQVSLAIALGTRAPILLLDEPLASLDPLARGEFLQLLRDAVRADGSTALLSSHVVRDVEQGCDSLIVLGVGRVLLSMTLQAALKNHRVVEGAAVELNADQLVSALPGGRRLVRVSEDYIERSQVASVEDIVLGYLGRGRQVL